MDFYDLDLNDQALDALDDMNFTECTPIQEHAIPVILEGRDLIGVADKIKSFFIIALFLIDNVHLLFL